MYDIVTPFVAKWEGFSASPYFCPTDHLTIGYGTLVKRGHRYNGVAGGHIIHIANQIRKRFKSRYVRNQALYKHFGNLLSERQAQHILKNSLRSFWRQIAPSLPHGLNDNQCAAILSLAYNIGVRAFKSSTFLKRLKVGDIKGAAQALTWWNKGRVDGRLQVIAGLKRRRKAEKELFLYKE